MTHEGLKAKALARPEVRKEYEALVAEFEALKRKLQAHKRWDRMSDKPQSDCDEV